MNENNYKVINDIFYDGLVKEIYVFSGSHTPKDLLEYLEDEKYTALVVYRYFNGTWDFVSMLSGNDNYQAAVNCVYDEYEDFVKNKNIKFFSDEDEYDESVFVKSNRYTNYYA